MSAAHSEWDNTRLVLARAAFHEALSLASQTEGFLRCTGAAFVTPNSPEQ